MKRGRSADAMVRDDSTRRRAALRAIVQSYVKMVALVVIIVAAVIGIVFAPLGMALLAKGNREWALLGNVGQAYGGVSALISALALIGVSGALLVQARQHKLDRLTAVRGQHSYILSVVREDLQLYAPVMGEDLKDERSTRRRWLRIEALQYLATGFDTGLLTEEALRSEAFPGFFRYEENRQFWETANSYWLSETRGRKRRKFVKIANEELAYAKSTGQGLPLPYSSDQIQESTLKRRSDWQLSAFAGAAAVVSVAFLFSAINHANDGPTAKASKVNPVSLVRGLGHEQLRRTTFYEPPHDVTHRQGDLWPVVLVPVTRRRCAPTL